MDKKKIETMLTPEDYAELERMARKYNISKYKIVEIAVREFIKMENAARNGTHILGSDCVLGKEGTILIDIPEDAVDRVLDMVKSQKAVGIELPITEITPNDSVEISNETKEIFSDFYNAEDVFEYEKPKRRRL